MAASPAIVTPLRFPVGRFFPNGCEADARDFETFPATFPLHAHYLPTRECLRAAENRFGPAARPLLLAWREVWRAAVGDVDAFAKEMDAPALGPERPEDAPEYPGWPGPNFIRPAAFHVMEDAATLTEALRIGTPFALRVGKRGKEREFAPVPGLRRIARYADIGARPENPRFEAPGVVRPGQVFKTSEKATAYWSSAAFRERAGRGMAVARKSREMVDILLDMSAQGHAQAFVKSVTSKGGTWVVDLPPGCDADAVKESLLATMGDYWTRFDQPGPRSGYLIQGMTPFVREHRFYVVRHRVVASTASDRMLSALDADDARILDGRVARLDVPADTPGYYDRGFSTWEADRGLVARMAWGARDLARALRADDKGLDCYAIDMGQTADGRVLPIEVNGLPRAGHYGVPYGRVLRALRRRADGVAEGVLALERRPRQVLPVERIASAAVREARRILAEGDADLLYRFMEPRTKRKPIHEWLRTDKPDPLAPRRVAGEIRPISDVLAEIIDESLSAETESMGLLPEGPSPEPLVAPGGPLRRAWVKRTYKKAHLDCFDRAIDLADRLDKGRLALSKPILCIGRPLAEEAKAPGWAHGWLTHYGNHLRTLPGAWSVAISAGMADIDWDLTLASRASGISLAANGAARIVRVKSRPGLPDAGISVGETVTTTAVAAATVATKPDVSGLDTDELLAMIPEDPDWQAKYLRKHSSDFVSRATLAVGNPGDWERLRRDIVERARVADRDRRLSIVRDTVSLVSECSCDEGGRILLTRLDEPGRYLVEKNPVGEPTGPFLVAGVGDIDVMGTVLALCGSERRWPPELHVVLREGARTWPVPGHAVVERRRSTPSGGGRPPRLVAGGPAFDPYWVGDNHVDDILGVIDMDIEDMV